MRIVYCDEFQSYIVVNLLKDETNLILFWHKDSENYLNLVIN